MLAVQQEASCLPSQNQAVVEYGVVRVQETRCFDALAELYGMLNEEDVLCGLWKRRGAADETRAALSCIQHGVLQAGQDFLLDAISKAALGEFPAPSPGLKAPC
jgi:transformation/transcription domain-associated protein